MIHSPAPAGLSLFPAVQFLMPHITSKTVARAIYTFACNYPPLAFKCESGADSPANAVPYLVMPHGFLDFFENAKNAQHFVIRAVVEQLSDFLVRHGVCAGCVCPKNPVSCRIERFCNADECRQPWRFLAELNVGEMHHRNVRFFRQLSLCKPDFAAQVGNAPADGGGTAVSIHCFSPLRR